MTGRGGFTLIEVLATLTVLSLAAMGIMRFASQAQDMSAEIDHIETMSRLASMEMFDLEKEGFSSSTDRSGEFEDEPGYDWTARSNLLREGGWYRMKLTVRRKDSGRTLVMERIFREQL